MATMMMVIMRGYWGCSPHAAHTQSECVEHEERGISSSRGLGVNFISHYIHRTHIDGVVVVELGLQYEYPPKKKRHKPASYIAKEDVTLRTHVLLILWLFLLPSDNVQHDLQHGPLITFPKEEHLRNKRKPMHQVYLPSVPTFGLSTLFAVCAPSFSLRSILNYELTVNASRSLGIDLDTVPPSTISPWRGEHKSFNVVQCRLAFPTCVPSKTKRRENRKPNKWRLLSDHVYTRVQLDPAISTSLTGKHAHKYHIRFADWLLCSVYSSYTIDKQKSN